MLVIPAEAEAEAEALAASIMLPIRPPAVTALRVIPETPPLETVQAAMLVRGARVPAAMVTPEVQVTPARLATLVHLETPELELLQEERRPHLGRDKLVLLAAPVIRGPREMQGLALQLVVQVIPEQVEAPAQLVIPARLVMQVLLDRLCLPRHIQV